MTSQSASPRQLHQDRSRETRRILVDAAADEFSRRSYSAASVDSILAASGRTKGAMYFHFTSKQALAQAVLDDAESLYAEIGSRWQQRSWLHPFAALAGIVDDIAAAFTESPIVQAEARMSLEPSFYPRIEQRASQAWEAAGVELATIADGLSLFKPGFTPQRLIRSLATMLAGQRYMADLIAGPTLLRDRFAESFDTVLAAMTTVDGRRFH